MTGEGVLDRVAALLSRVPGAERFEGARAVARREIIGNIKSVRMIVVTALLMLSVVGGAAGFSALVGGGAPDPSGLTIPFAHAAWPDGPSAQPGIVVWVADPWGEPRSGAVVQITDDRGMAILDSGVSDSNGNVVFRGLNGTGYWVQLPGEDGRGISRPLAIPPAPQPFAADMLQIDLSSNGSSGDILVHAVNETGAPLAGATILENNVAVATLDTRGFAHLVRGPGTYNLSIEQGGVTATFIAHVNEPQPSIFSGGANPVMLVVAAGFIPLILPIMAISVAHDAIARERAQGSLESLLSRPTTRWGVILGKFVGSTVALLLPVYASLALGAVVIGAMTGRNIDGVFFGGILVGVTAYTAAYVLVLLILSTLARTTGTAIMFGVLLWLIYNLLWEVITFLIQLAAGLTPSDRAFYDVAIFSSLFNLNSLYGAMISITFPGGANPFVFNGEALIPDWGPFVAYAVWLIALFLLALWVFDRKAAE